MKKLHIDNLFLFLRDCYPMMYTITKKSMKKCLWCLKNEKETLFNKRAHTVPKSLGGEKLNSNICNNCNEYFGNKQENNFSIEEALKEAFNITRKRFLLVSNPKRKTGKLSSRFFEIKEKKNTIKLSYKTSFRFDNEFQKTLCRSFKRGLYKLYLEELNRQKDLGFEEEYDLIRKFSRYNENDLPIFYFYRKIPLIAFMEREAESPQLYFDRMKYLFSNEFFEEIEFLGHVFGFPKKEFKRADFDNYVIETTKLKTDFFTSFSIIEKFTDMDISLNVMNR